LFQAYTGCRTQEVLELRIDGMSERNAGFVEDGILYLNRAKHGINNWVRIHPDLRELLRVHRCWLAARYPSSPWYLPSPKNAFKSVNHDSLTHALRRLAPLIVGYPVTAHSLRAYFVTVRRSHGVGDAEIALEIGQVSGGREIVKTYGESRPKKLGWKSEEGEQAWVVFRALEKVVPMAGKRATA
jgi:integrase